MRNRWLYRTLLTLVGLAAAGGVAFVILAWRPAIAPEAGAAAFEPALVRRGAHLAAIGNCNICHTREGGPPYAGGRPIPTPFGTIFSTNITPDPDTGIGQWSEAAFTRAMREGVARDGHHLYPAFPYDHMTRMNAEDIRAVYAFMMTRRPVQATAPANDLPFPLKVRPLIAGWKLLFLDRDVVRPNPAESPEWNRGAYLVEGLAHCGACHTPRNLLGAEKQRQAYAGGTSEGWIAPALNAASPAAVPWESERLHRFLRDGFDPLHGAAVGPMMPVVKNLAGVPEDEVRAIATYVAAMAGAPTPQRRAEADTIVARATAEGGVAREDAPPDDEGAAIYAGACALCHGEAGRQPTLRALNLSLSSALRLSTPDNIVRIVRDGIQPAEGATAPIMPGFAHALTDPQIARLVAYLRRHFTDKPAWPGIDQSIRRAKDEDADRTRSAQQARMTR